MTARNRIYQMAFVVDDLDEAMARWTAMTGAGPWFVIPHFAFLEPKLRGREAAPDISIALAYSGEVMLELIRCESAAPSVFTETPPGTGALHHVAQLTDDFDATIAGFAANGAAAVFTARFTPETRAAFVDTRAAIGCWTEVIEATPPLIGMQQFMRTQTDAWDGRTDVKRGF
jgi:hypothetical protein